MNIESFRYSLLFPLLKFIITQVVLDPVPPPEPDPRPPPPPPEPRFPAPAGPQVFVVRRGVPGAVGPGVAALRPPLQQRPPLVAQPIPGQPMDILQEILRQQQVLRIQQEALQQQQQQPHHPLPAAQGAPPPEVPLPPGPGDPGPALPELGPPVGHLNALQAWQLDWQQQQHLHMQNLQPFLAEQPAAAAAAHPARQAPAAPPPPGAIHTWEQESATDRERRHARSKKMAEASSHDKRTVQQQASAMMGVRPQSGKVNYLPSFP